MQDQPTIGECKAKKYHLILSGRNLTHAPNGNNPLSPPKRGEGWGEGFVLVNIGLLTPALSSLREEREKNGAGVNAPVRATRYGF